jgi:hypothetical protein
MEQHPFRVWLKRFAESIVRVLGIERKREKTFLIHSNRVEDAPTRRVPSGGFQVQATTRPQICPVCRTSGGRIERTADSRFRCRSCGHDWS